MWDTLGAFALESNSSKGAGSEKGFTVDTVRPLDYCATYCASGRRRTKIPTAPSNAAKMSIGSVVIGPV